jgi:excisionase family DNA binding protein
MPSQPSNLYLTVQEVAARLHVSDKTIYRRIEMLELRAHRIGRSVRIASAELERYIESHSTTEDWG